MKQKYVQMYEDFNTETEMKTNKEKVSDITNELLDTAIPHIREYIEKAINSGAIDIDSWDENYAPMIIPKTILIASLQAEAEQYQAYGTKYEKEIKKDLKNLKYFL